MNTKSIRFRLTFWYTVSLVVAIIVIFISFYFVTRQALHTQTENTLTSHSQKIVEVVTREGSNMHQAIVKEAFVEEFSNIPGMLVVIINSSGTIVSSSQTVSPTDGVIKNFFKAASLSEKPFFADRIIGSQSLRFLITPIMQNNSLLGVVIIGHPIDVIAKALNNLVTMLGVVFVAFLIPVVLGGYLNARGAVAPISDISKKLKLINSGNLDKRINNPHTGDEIEELSVTFNSLLDRLHSAFIRERQFIGDVAHELKTPLSAQRTNIEVALSKDRSKEEFRDTLEESLVDNNQLSSTLKNILDLAWAQADSAKLQLDRVNLSQIVLDVKDLTMKMVHKKQIAVKGIVQPDIFVNGRKDKLFRSILNIVDNAVTYTPEKGTITISLHKKNGLANIHIKDTGIGIAEKDLPHIFERFYRGSTRLPARQESDKVFGSGLGLAIASATITAHQGSVEVKSKAGKGSEFTVLLPLS